MKVRLLKNEELDVSVVDHPNVSDMIVLHIRNDLDAVRIHVHTAEGITHKTIDRFIDGAVRYRGFIALPVDVSKNVPGFGEWTGGLDDCCAILFNGDIVGTVPDDENVAEALREWVSLNCGKES